ncbi:MAG: hypothetical protein L0227_17045 [Chloroflexi bacterium]|nr:hypothetical protein [Chloroflexota bacterium]
MTSIEVHCRATAEGWGCHVAVQSADGSATSHEVTVARDDLARHAPGADDPSDLVRRSFEFLLDREPKESILRRFDLRVIGRYFPEYEATNRRDR